MRMRSSRDKLSRMRRFWALAWCVILLAAGVGPLRQLLDQGRIFELRRRLLQQDGNDAQTLFYRAVVAARFGHETAAIEDLRRFVATHPERVIARKAS
jgi:hypothetical protein